MKSDDELLLRRLTEMAQRAANRDAPVETRFLKAEDRSMAESSARKAGVQAVFDGGYEDAERVQCCFCPEGAEPVFSAMWVQAKWNAKFGSVDHRALLGALMAFGMDRSFLGDILVEADRAYVRALPELAERLPGEWTEAGRVSLRCTVLTEAPMLAPAAGTMLTDTVASLRLDSVLASGMKTSRAKACDWIREGLVQVDHRETERTDLMLHEGSLISVRGFGRMRLCAVAPPTRKDRIPIRLEVFGKK